jgi:chloramphenicol O-acetyltransferase
MSAVLLEIEDNKAPFLMELLHQFSFVKARSVNNVETLLFKESVNTVDRVKIKEEIYPATNRNAARFKGLLTEQEAEKYHNYLQTARQEWDRNI